MHFHSLAVIQLPHMEEDHEVTEQIKLAVAELEQKENRDIICEFMVQSLKGQMSSFARAVCSAIEEMMYPYGRDSEEYYELFNLTEHVCSQYENGYCDCVRLPDGRVVNLHHRTLRSRFEIYNGLVFEKEAGQMKHPMRTHRAKKMDALPDYPFKKQYKSLHAFASEYYGYVYDEASQQYGYYCNPNATWDGYQIGGRWPCTFLVKNTCTEYSCGERSWSNANEVYPVPEGFMWVCAARKKDIEWQAMKEWNLQQEKQQFHALEAMFSLGEEFFETHLRVEDGCVYSFSDLVYRIGESEEAYLTRVKAIDERKYTVSFCDLVNYYYWIAQGEEYFSPDEDCPPCLTWDDTIQQFIDDLDDDDVLVSLDYHM